MSQLLAFSFDAPASPSLTLKGTMSAATRGIDEDAYGWGMAWYPPDDRAAVVIKDPTAVSDDPLTRVLRDWSRFRSTIFLCHLRGAASRRSQDDTQPFVRIIGDRSWLIAHHGQLRPGFETALDLGKNPLFEPLGHTDTEHLLCWLLGKARKLGARTLAEVGWQNLHLWFGEANQLGTLNILLSDGHDLVAYQDTGGFHPLHWARVSPKSRAASLEDDEVFVDLANPLDTYRTALLVATKPLAEHGFEAFPPGRMAVIRRSVFGWLSDADPDELNRRVMPPSSTESEAPEEPHSVGQVAAAASSLAAATPRPRVAESTVARDSCVLEVTHTTRYTYESPVEMSRHVLRLRPVIDSRQELLEHTLLVSPDGPRRQYEDVFGNHVVRVDEERPFEELEISSHLRVRVYSDPRSEIEGSRRRSTIPVPWMPWDRQMMNPYLLPPELPETQLRELFDYAMTFVERQDYDLIETLDDMNRTIFREWSYKPSSTTLETTPFEVFSERSGVCQDFANLLISLARLIGIPSRYRTGYIYTGNDAANPMQSDASHAWVELYLPLWGWTGFDPTNGCRANLDHVRVACGRNYRDATPTSGTIFRGGGGTETLKVDVRVIRSE